ncbi:DUF6461 domain-containing protein [Streptomyces sp. NPDC045431]|uniref:DUF6461 domain-containing protein n=1 Tax=Streptomyces sp. NPDC045431 TaxID=3155613 RepID=UPI0033F1EC4C
MTTTAADYAWFEDRFPDLAEAYCFTLVENLAPADVLHRLDGREEAPLTGAEAVGDAAFALFSRTDGTRQLVAMTALGSWTLLIEPNGYLGVTEARALPASAGTRWVSHFVNVNAVDAFLWAEDGVRRLWFEPLFPDERWGTTPDDLLDAMHRIGFHFGDGDAPEPDLSGPAAFALAEHLTGVALTAELLEGTTFTCGSVEVR